MVTQRDPTSPHSQVAIARIKADAQRELSGAILEGQRAVAAAEAKAATAEAAVAAAQSGVTIAEQKLHDEQARKERAIESEV